MKCMSIEMAETIMEEAKKTNPGKWINHSYVVAECAKKIASKCKYLDEDIAYSLGLLHDIGRHNGEIGLRHIVLGYQFMKSYHADDNARICLTHSFPYQNSHAFTGINNCSEDETKLFKKFIQQIQYDDYDRLIQLCDGISLSSGPVIIEKRLVDVTLRHGFNDYTLDKWKAYFDLKGYFDRVVKKDIYDLL